MVNTKTSIQAFWTSDVYYVFNEVYKRLKGIINIAEETLIRYPYVKIFLII